MSVPLLKCGNLLFALLLCLLCDVVCHTIHMHSAFGYFSLFSLLHYYRTVVHLGILRIYYTNFLAMLLIADRKDVSYLTFIHLLHLLLWLKILTREKKRDSWIEFRWPCQAFFPSGFCSGRQFSHISDVCLLVLVVYIHAFSAVECLFGNLLITSTGFGWSCRWSARKAAAPTKAFFIDHRTLTHTHTDTHAISTHKL